MAMTQRERILAAVNGQTPDKVPFMLDLSHYYYEKNNKEWNILSGYVEPEYDLIDYHRKFDAGFYIPNQALMFSSAYGPNTKVDVKTLTVEGNPEIHWRYETPLGVIERIRIWEPASYSWAIKKWGVTTEEDLRVLGYAMADRSFSPLPDNYVAWKNYVGDLGVVYLTPGYSAMGYLLNYWMGIENTVYACMDWEDTMHEVVDMINDSNLKQVEMLARYPGEIILMGDNFSSDIQPPSFFAEWSADYYRRAIEIFHLHGKKVAVHVDGKLRGAIGMIRDVGADIIDATTPPPMGDLTPAQCREEAGPTLVLSGGVSPDLWLPSAPVETFKQAVMDWLDLRHKSPALIAAAGDQVPPGAEECRIEIMHEMVEQYGAY